MWKTCRMINVLCVYLSCLSLSMVTAMIRRSDPSELPEEALQEPANVEVQEPPDLGSQELPELPLLVPPELGTIEHRIFFSHARTQILCRGRVPFELYNKFDEQFPERPPGLFTYPTVRSICALPQNGGNVDWNAGMYCGWRLTYPRLVFSEMGGTGDDYARYGLWDYVAIFCQSRCRCIDIRRREIATPDPEVLSAELNPYSNLDLNPIRAFPNEDRIRLTLMEYHGPHIRVSVVPLTEFLYHFERVDPEVYAVLPQEGTYKPTCSGDLPSTSLPPPFSNHRFESIVTLCVAEVFGGDPQGNAGSVCESSSKRNDVFRFDEVYQHPALLRIATPEAYAVNVWCEIHCRCNSVQAPKRVRAYHDKDKGLYEPKFTKNGGLNLRRKQDGKVSIVTVINPTAISNKDVSSKQNVCALVSALPVDDTSYCDSSLGVDLSRGRPDRYAIRQALLFSRPRLSSPPPVYLGRTGELLLLPKDSDAESATCTASPPATCRNFKDCASSLASDCRCTLNLAQNMASVATLASVLTTFSCTSLSARTAVGEIRNLRLGGRNTALEDWVCACNGTFASRTCCERVDGMVWEGEGEGVELKL